MSNTNKLAFPASLNRWELEKIESEVGSDSKALDVF